MDAATTSQRPTLTYKGVHALLLHWQDGSESMYKELSRLRDVLGDTYCYDVKEWQIPRKDSHCELNAYLLEWRKAHGAKGNLLIVYYAGHGIMGKGRESVWLCSDRADSERVNWTALQVVLTSGTESDVLIIADCCHSGSPGYPSEIRAYGVVELLAACGFESAAPVDGEHCFTHNLVEQLKEDHGRNRKTSQFHTDLQFRLSNYRPSGIEQRVSAILCRLVDVQDDYSIRLAHLPRAADPKRRRVTPLLARQHSTLGSGRGAHIGDRDPSQSSIEQPEADRSTPPLEDQIRNGPGQLTLEPPEIQSSQPPQEDLVRILQQAFSFPSAENRYWQVDDAHRETFQWIFQQGHRSRFAEWLRGDGGFYWISGKPGSGKSTLMKTIIESPETRRFLGLWAGERPLDIVSYFFWNPGTSLQRSFEGCLRSMVCQLLPTQPELASKLFDNVAQQYEASAWNPSYYDAQVAFEFLLRSYDNSRRLCIFIDGLDECDADHFELCQRMVSLAQMGGIKICASSREWKIFADTFGHYPQLSLHTLTKTDIERYVRYSLTDDQRFNELAKRHSDAADKIVSGLTTKSCGVFIWLRLAMRSIHEGLNNYDSIDGLLRRLEELSPDIENLYRDLLDSVEPCYKKSTLMILRLFIASQVQVISPTSQIPASEPLLTNVGLFLAEEARFDRDLVFQGTVEPWIEGQIMDIEGMSRREVETRTRGLLSVEREPHRALKGDYQQSPGQLISYIHQTVRMFIERYVEEQGSMIDDDFDPELLLLESSVIRLKKLDMGKPSRSMEEGVFHLECWTLVDQAMNWASKVQFKNTDRMIKVLCELDRVMTVQFELWSGFTSQGHWSRVLPLGIWQVQDWKNNFLSLAISYGIFHFVEDQIGQLDKAKEGRPLLDYALLPNFTASVDPRIVRLLVAEGADPNAVFCGETVLNRFRDAFSKLAGPPSLVQAEELASLRDLLEFLEKVSQEKLARSRRVFLSWGLLCLAILVVVFAVLLKA